MRIEDDMNSVTEEELLADKPLPQWMKKLYVRVIAVFLVVLMLSLVLLNYDIIGQLVSKPVDENVLYLNDITVRFADSPIALIFDSYDQELETPLCLQGSRDGSEYNIKSAYIPTMFDRSRTHVTHASCEDTLILFHTHPYKSCLASGTDLNTLSKNQKLDPDIIMIVMCEPNRFSLYS